jgi:hypothetical protein
VDIQNLQQQSDHQHEFVWLYYNPDGSLRGEMKRQFIMKRESRQSSQQHGWGWEEPGKWPAGVYTVHVLIDKQKVGENEFEIVPEKR